MKISSKSFCCILNFQSSLFTTHYRCRYLVLELCVATVDDYIRGNKMDILFQINMPSELNALKQMANGLLYIHLQLFVHRDIKPANVLISQSGILKISDFGFSRLVSVSGNFSAKSSPKGTRIYYAPEYLELEEKSFEEKKSIRANKSIDIFSLGCLFCSYITKGGHPFAKKRFANEIFILPNIIEGKKFLANNGMYILLARETSRYFIELLPMDIFFCCFLNSKV